MPLVTACVLAYAAGLLTGLTTFAAWTVPALALVVVNGARCRRDRLALLALGAAGAAMGHVAGVEDRACLSSLAGSRQWTVRIEADVAPGSFVRGRAACGARVRLAVSDGRAPSDALVQATGEVTRSFAGVLMKGARIVTVAPPGPAARWRAGIGRGIDGVFGGHAPMVRALLIADMRELTPALRERFAAAGLVHMLSVSGLHTGLIAAAVLLAAQLLGVGHGRARIAAAGITALYVLIIGAPLPAVRAALMLGALSLSRLAQRPTSPWALLAVGAGLPLVDPRSVVNLGYQLSIVGMVALVSAGALARRWTWLADAGWRGTLYRSLATSTLATLFTAPLVAATFGQASLVAPLTNLAAGPVIGVLQPMLFLAALLLPVTAMARFVADACHPLLVAFDRLATAGASLPGASIMVVTDRLSLGLATACVAGIAVACASRHPGRALMAAAACLAAIAWRPLLPAPGGFTELHMLDVGQGDALALRTARGSWVLFDAGRAWDGGDAGRRIAVPYIASRGGRLHAFVLSHPHADHAGGAASAIRALRPAWYFDPGYAGATESYAASLRSARDAGTRWERVRAGDSLVVDEAIITWLAPDSAWADTLRDPNDASVVARVRVGSVAMLLTGDAEAALEGWLLRHRAGDLRADILKVAHHGSGTSSSAAFLDAVRPRLALVSVGAGNPYRHPHPEVMRSLALRGAVVMRSDLHGAVVVRTDGRRIQVDAEGDRFALH